MAVAGTTTQGTAECQIVTTTIQTTGTTTTVCALPFSLVQMMDVNCSKQYLIMFIFLYEQKRIVLTVI